MTEAISECIQLLSTINNVFQARRRFSFIFLRLWIVLRALLTNNSRGRHVKSHEVKSTTTYIFNKRMQFLTNSVLDILSILPIQRMYCNFQPNIIENNTFVANSEFHICLRNLIIMFNLIKWFYKYDFFILFYIFPFNHSFRGSRT